MQMQDYTQRLRILFLKEIATIGVGFALLPQLGAIGAAIISLVMAHLSTLRRHLMSYFPESAPDTWLVAPFQADVT